MWALLLVLAVADAASLHKDVTTTAKPITPSPWFECPRPHGLFPNPYDCQKFFHCYQGTAWSLECDYGLSFNPNISTCDYRVDVKCSTSTTAEPDVDKLQETTQEITTTTKPPPTPSPWFKCPKTEGFFPNPFDCHKYFHCFNDYAWAEHCAANLVFNPKKSACDYDANVNCVETTTAQMLTEKLEENAETTQEITTTTKPPPTPSPWFKCPKPEGFFPNPFDCHKYFHCFSDIPWAEHCSSTLVFNPEKNACDFDANVHCVETTTAQMPTEPLENIEEKLEENAETTQEITTTTKPPPTPSPWFKCPKTEGFFPNPFDCHKYFHCFNDYAWAEHCAANLVFNPKKSACDYDANVNCVETTTAQMPTEKLEENAETTQEITTTTKPPPTPSPWFKCPKPEGFFPNPFDCHKYFHCFSDIPWAEHCSSTLVFNPEKNACDFDANVHCVETTTAQMPTVS